MQTQKQDSPSPVWGRNVKLIVGMTMVFILGALLVKFQFIISPLMVSLLLAYLLYPLAELLHRRLKFSWSAAVGIVYLLFVILLLGLLTWGGVILAQQGQSAISTLTFGLEELPTLAEEYASKISAYLPEPMRANLTDVQSLTAQISSMAQPAVAQIGSLLGAFAGSAANFFGWTIFVIFVSYFIAAESGGFRNRLVTFSFPGYDQDIARLTRETSRIWNAFMRGQVSLFFLTLAIYAVTLELLGVRYALTLALISGLARFLPYVGPAINWVVLTLIVLFQEYHLFNLPAMYYALLVLLVAVVIDMMIDYMITPRIYSDTLSVHPAALLVAAIVAASLFGLLGVIVSAPIFATFMLLWHYITRKMLDLDPWSGLKEPPLEAPSIFVKLRALLDRQQKRAPKRKP